MKNQLWLYTYLHHVLFWIPILDSGYDTYASILGFKAFKTFRQQMNPSEKWSYLTNTYWLPHWLNIVQASSL